MTAGCGIDASALGAGVIAVDPANLAGTGLIVDADETACNKLSVDCDWMAGPGW